MSRTDRGHPYEDNTTTRFTPLSKRDARRFGARPALADRRDGELRARARLRRGRELVMGEINTYGDSDTDIAPYRHRHAGWYFSW